MCSATGLSANGVAEVRIIYALAQKQERMNHLRSSFFPTPRNSTPNLVQGESIQISIQGEIIEAFRSTPDIHRCSPLKKTPVCPIFNHVRQSFLRQFYSQCVKNS